jgi:transglutaminase-like putative cysteine protease
MGSWRRWTNTYALGALALVVAVVTGCNASTAADDPGPFAAGAEVIVAGSGGPASTGGPLQTAAPNTVDQITVDYVYQGTLVTPLAHLYGVKFKDIVIVTVENGSSSSVRISVTSEITGFTDKASDTVTVEAGASAEVRQDPRLTTAAIDGLNSQKYADLHVVVTALSDGKTILDQTSAVTITSRRDFPWMIKGYSAHEVHEFLAVMVTRDDPAVAELIRKAAEYAPGRAMGAGATSGDPNKVIAQLAAVWQAEADDYNLTYVSTTETFQADYQRIRLPGEVLPEASGNCIELSLLYAAVAESLGFPPFLILVPGHAYMAVQVDDQGNAIIIETTMIGSATFTKATQTGGAEWKEAQPEINAGNEEYDVVNVKAARDKGITPIPWH